jgi:phosphoenolpyruvate---glycerone phosphotransferase subunit DhaL
MMRSKLTPADMRQVLLAVADEIIGAETRLNALDAALGDGDHGITMRLGFEAIKKRLAEIDASANFREVFTESGKVFMGATGGAIGIILGKSLMSVGTSLRDAQEFGTPELGAMLASMDTAIAQAGKAKPGDKTILDAVHAANEAAERAVQANQSLGEALEGSAAAAESAAQKTAEMICRVGRASRLGERTLGHPDPGATSFSIILRVFQRCVAAE